jgi:hypothetical protein
MVSFTLKKGIFGLISEGQMMIRIRQVSQKMKNILKTFFPWKFWVANPNVMDKIYRARKKCPVSANVK